MSITIVKIITVVIIQQCTLSESSAKAMPRLYNADAATELRFHNVLLEHLPWNGFLNRAEPLLLQLPQPFSEDSTCFPQCLQPPCLGPITLAKIQIARSLLTACEIQMLSRECRVNKTAGRGGTPWCLGCRGPGLALLMPCYSIDVLLSLSPGMPCVIYAMCSSSLLVPGI